MATVGRATGIRASAGVEGGGVVTLGSLVGMGEIVGVFTLGTHVVVGAGEGVGVL